MACSETNSIAHRSRMKLGDIDLGTYPFQTRPKPKHKGNAVNETQHKLALPKGTRIGDFEFHRVLGHGGFGITYLGWNLALDIPVAIKEYLPADLATRESDLSVVPQSSQAMADFQWGLDRFIDEARILARFQHPNIVRVHHFFEAHRTAYIVMEYAEGETLSAYLNRKGVLTEAELKAILHPILDGLEVVHRADFLHRDIKPGNIIIRDEDDSPVLLDFGAARLAIGAKSRSVTSIVTPGYAPIEQYESRGNQGPWTDIYALGCVCYRALTGDVPVPAMDRVRRDPLIPVSERCKGRASHPFLAAIDHALQVDESARPQSASEWRAELGDVPVVTPPETRVDVPPQVPETSPNTPRPAPARAQESIGEHKGFNRVMWIVSGVIVLVFMALGISDYVEKQQQAEIARQKQAALEKQRREQEAEIARQKQAAQRATLARERNKFVAEMGHEPSLHGVNSDGETDLHLASYLNLPTLTLYLLNTGADVNARDDNGFTPLHAAAWANAHETAEVLLKHRAYVNARDDNGVTPLWIATWKAAHETAALLRRYGGRR